MKKSKSIHLGTSGWNYKHWKGAFYPEDLSQNDWLEYYAGHFHTVEINNSFYQLPEQKTFERWRKQVPDGFTFAVKASRYITHMKKLKEPQQSLKNFMKRVTALENKLGPILFQLPPRWRFNFERLEDFLKALPSDFKYAFEFRDASWRQPETYEALARHKAAFCIYQLKGELAPKEVTTDFVYVRLHGPKQAAYKGQYTQETLAGWVGAFSAWTKQGKKIYCYFDNDEKGYAAQDALKLQNMIED